MSPFSLPGEMGRCEVEAGIGVTLDVGVAVEFGAVVGGDSADGAGLALDQLRGPAAELLGGACIELTDLEVSGLAFHEGDDAGLAVAEHGVGLPVANAGSVVCCGWALLDGSLACQSSSRVVGAVSLVVPDVSVDGLMADLETSFEIQSAGDLLGAPVLLHQQDLDHVPVRRGEAEVSS